MAGGENGPVDALFVSPHFDDVALSCGGTVALEARRGRALVVTVFAGGPAESLNPFAEFQHRRWRHQGDAVEVRRQEDTVAMAVLGADIRWLSFPDAIYRDRLYLSDDELFGPVKPEDAAVQQAVENAIASLVVGAAPRTIYLPLGIGEHVDHQICHRVGARLARGGCSVSFYEDFPYAANPGAVETRIRELRCPLSPALMPVTETFERRLEATRAYESQLPTIFRDHGDAEEVIRRYAASLGGEGYAERFWRPGGHPAWWDQSR